MRKGGGVSIAPFLSNTNVHPLCMPDLLGDVSPSPNFELHRRTEAISWGSYSALILRNPLIARNLVKDRLKPWITSETLQVSRGHLFFVHETQPGGGLQMFECLICASQYGQGGSELEVCGSQIWAFCLGGTRDQLFECRFSLSLAAGVGQG